MDKKHTHTHNHHNHHNHGYHHHHHHEIPKKITTSFFIAMLLNLAFTIIEVIYALHANSSSLLADAGHNFGDVFGLFIGWIASLLLTKKTSEKHTYGYKKLSIFAAFLNAVILLSSSVLIGIDAIIHLFHPEHVIAKDMIIIALIGIAINGGTALLFSKGHSDLNIKAAFMHLAYDALISLGVAITGVIIFYTRFNIIDPIVSLIIIAFIIYSTWGLLKQSINLALDAVPDNINFNKVEEFFNNQPEIDNAHHMHIWPISTQETAITVHLVVNNTQIALKKSFRTNIEKQLKDLFNIQHVTIQIESKKHSC